MPKKPKKPTLKKLKHQADEAFSRYIRQREANDIGFVACITCGQFVHWKDGDCGHYFSRNKLATRYHEKNAHFQCKSCNIFRKGNYPIYASVLYRKYGQKFMDELEAESRKLVKFSTSDYEEMIQEFEKKTEALKK